MITQVARTDGLALRAAVLGLLDLTRPTTQEDERDELTYTSIKDECGLAPPPIIIDFTFFESSRPIKSVFHESSWKTNTMFAYVMRQAFGPDEDSV